MTPHEFAERCLLGLLLAQPGRISEVGPHLAATDFDDAGHGALFTLLGSNHTNLLDARPDGMPAHQWAAHLATAIPDIPGQGIDVEQLTELMSLAPPGGGQPAVYAQMVMEASIRRQITQLGLDVAQFSAHTPQLSEILAAQQAITEQIASAQQRWDSITQTRTLSGTLNPDPITNPDPTGSPGLPPPTQPAPTPAELHAAQQHVIGAILAEPATADALLGRLIPSDFPDTQLGNTLQAAIQVHTQTATTGRQVDPVTVAWALQTLPDEHGASPSPQALHELAHTAAPGDLDSAVDLVMRASLAARTAHAAATTQHAAQQAALAPTEVLQTTRDAYQAVGDAADRMTGRTSTDYQLTVLNNHAHTAPRSTTDLASLRSRSTHLAATTMPAATSTPHHSLSARLDTRTPTASSSIEGVLTDADLSPA